MGFLHIGQAGLELLTSGDPPASAFQNAGITGMSHHTPPNIFYFKIYAVGKALVQKEGYLDCSPNCDMDLSLDNSISYFPHPLSKNDITYTVARLACNNIGFTMLVKLFLNSRPQVDNTVKRYKNKHTLKILDWAQWLMSVISVLWEAKVDRLLEPQSSRPTWITWSNPISTKKNTKISQVWWCIPVDPVTGEAETAFHHDGQAGLELLTSGDPPTSASQSAKITGVSHHTRSKIGFTMLVRLVFYYQPQVIHPPWPPKCLDYRQLWDAKEGESLEIRSLRPAWPIWQNPISTKNAKINRAWWRMPTIPATQEAEAGESLEPARRRLQNPSILT
ncbi:hypothetical protein AAY473_005200 [Plecturocebus cupreus]